MKHLYRFNQEFGYGYTNLQGTFLATPEEVETIIDKEISFGDLFGNWGSVDITVNPEDITLLTTDEHFINQAVELGLVPSGLNPLKAYIRPD